jgi:flagellar export protein FliJ
VTRFRFRLDSVLAWRRAQLEAEEFRLRQLLQACADARRRMAEAEEERRETERRVRAADAVPAADLWALAGWREAARARAAELAAACRRADEEAGRQREAVAAARRRCRLLERLRERRLEDWLLEERRELENLASDAYLARWNRL